MSAEATTWAWGLRGLKSPDKLVILSYARYANEAGYAWRSGELVAKETGLHRDTVRLAIKRLLEAGHMVKTDQMAGRTAQCIVYQLVGVQSAEKATENGQKKPSGIHKGSENHTLVDSGSNPTEFQQKPSGKPVQIDRLIDTEARERARMTCGHARSRLKQDRPGDLTWHGSLRLGFSPEDASGPYLVCPSRYVVDWVRQHPDVMDAFEIGPDSVLVGGIPDPETMLIPVESNGAWRRTA